VRQSDPRRQGVSGINLSGVPCCGRTTGAIRRSQVIFDGTWRGIAARQQACRSLATLLSVWASRRLGGDGQPHAGTAPRPSFAAVVPEPGRQPAGNVPPGLDPHLDVPGRRLSPPGFVPAHAAGRPCPLGVGTQYPTSAFTCPRPPLTGPGPARGGTRAPFDIDLAAWKPARSTRLPDRTGRLHPIPSTPVGWSRCRPMRAPNDASRQLTWPAARKRGPNWSGAAGLV